jgi:hypothetical protein
MTSITPELTPELLKHFKDKTKVASIESYIIKSFSDLVKECAKLSYLNKDYLLFYRGQTFDHQNKVGSSTFYPSIYRRDYLTQREVSYQFDILENACELLVESFQSKSIEGCQDVKKRKSIQWSILQHYEVCETPLLDFTQSLRVACSFALLDQNSNEGYVYVFGLPFITNRISVNSEQDIINIRLLSICPPTAIRPYFQEGYLAGTSDITNNYETKTELDFNRRLIAKFVIPNNKAFLGKDFNVIQKRSLFPSNDPISELCESLKNNTQRALRSGTLGDFLKSWVELEQKILLSARTYNSHTHNVRDALRVLFSNGYISEDQLHLFERLRKFRNIVVHQPKETQDNETRKYIQFLHDLSAGLQL